MFDDTLLNVASDEIYILLILKPRCLWTSSEWRNILLKRYFSSEETKVLSRYYSRVLWGVTYPRNFFVVEEPKQILCEDRDNAHGPVKHCWVADLVSSRGTNYHRFWYNTAQTLLSYWIFMDVKNRFHFFTFLYETSCMMKKLQGRSNYKMLLLMRKVGICYYTSCWDVSDWLSSKCAVPRTRFKENLLLIHLVKKQTISSEVSENEWFAVGTYFFPSSLAENMRDIINALYWNEWRRKKNLSSCDQLACLKSKHTGKSSISSTQVLEIIHTEKRRKKEAFLILSFPRGAESTQETFLWSPLSRTYEKAQYSSHSLDETLVVVCVNVSICWRSMKAHVFLIIVITIIIPTWFWISINDSDATHSAHPDYL